MQQLEEGLHSLWIKKIKKNNRFERRIYIPLPDYEARLFLFKNQMRKTPNILTEEDYDYLSTNSEGYFLNLKYFLNDFKTDFLDQIFQF